MRNRLCQAGNRFLGSLIGLQIRALAVVVPALQAGNRFLGSLKGLQVWTLRRKLKSRYGARNRFQEPSLEMSSQAT